MLSRTGDTDCFTVFDFRYVNLGIVRMELRSAADSVLFQDTNCLRLSRFVILCQLTRFDLQLRQTPLKFFQAVTICEVARRQRQRIGKMKATTSCW